MRMFAHQLVAGLQYLHAQGILFCDLKPANILIDEYGCLKLADFGLARRIPTQETLNSKPLAPGSPNYMAPELFQQPPIHSFASDFWALGCVLYELFTGNQPFTHTNFSELARLIQTEEVAFSVPGKEMSPAFQDLLQRLLMKDPQKRITWDKLVGHSFWEGLEPLSDVRLPHQELFDKKSELTRVDKELNQSSASSASSSDTHPNGDHPAVRDLLDEDPHLSSGESEQHSSVASIDSLEANSVSHSTRSRTTNPQDNADVKTEESRPTSAPNQHGRPPSDSERTKRESLNEREPGLPLSFHDGVSEKVPSSAPARMIHQAHAIAHSEAHALNSGAISESILPGVRDPSNLIFTAADNEVKPIIYGNEIEERQYPRVRDELLPIPRTSPEDLLSRGTHHLENHLREIYLHLKSCSDAELEPISVIDVKCNLLAYLHSLAMNSKLANVIVNSSILVLLVKTLCQGVGDPQGHQEARTLVPQICVVLGVLFRYVTFMSSSYPSQMNALVKALNYLVTHEADGSVDRWDWHYAEEGGRRTCAIACLGELLFYTSTQTEWTIPLVGLMTVLHSMEDSSLVIRHYATRTICNMLTQSADPNVIKNLVSERVTILLLRGLRYCVSELPLEGHAAQDEPNLWFATTLVQTISHQLRHMRFSSQLPDDAKGDILIALMKPQAVGDVWRCLSFASVSLELAIASITVCLMLFEMQLQTLRIEEKKSVHLNQLKRSYIQQAELIESVTKLLQPTYQFDVDSPVHVRGYDSDTVADSQAKKRYEKSSNSAPSILRAKTLLYLQYAVQFSDVILGEIMLNSLAFTYTEQLISRYAAQLRRLGDSRGKENPMENERSNNVAEKDLSPSDVYLLHCVVNFVKSLLRSAMHNALDILSESEGEKNASQRSTKSKKACANFFGGCRRLFKQVLLRSITQHYWVREKKEWAVFIRVCSQALGYEAISSQRHERRRCLCGEALLGCGCAGDSLDLVLLLLQGPDIVVNQLVDVDSELMLSHYLAGVTHTMELCLAQAEHPDHGADLLATCIRLLYRALLTGQVPMTKHGLEAQFFQTHMIPCIRCVTKAAKMLNESVWRLSIDLFAGLILEIKAYDSIPQRDLSLLLELVEFSIGSTALDHFQALPSSGTTFLKNLVISSYIDFEEIADNVTKALKYAAYRGASTCIVDLLEAIYFVAHRQYIESKEAHTARQPAKIGKLLLSSRTILVLCSSCAELNGDSVQEKQPSTDDISDLASRCLVYLSQVFGDQLNAWLFDTTDTKNDDVDVSCYILQVLEDVSYRPYVTFRVLLSLRNSLRSESGKVEHAREWLHQHGRVCYVIEQLQSPNNLSGCGIEDQKIVGQIAKAATDIAKYAQAR